MEDLWKLTRIDYRLPPVEEHKAYDEILRRFHTAEDGSSKDPLLNDKDLFDLLLKE